MNTIPNRQVVCETLLSQAEEDKDIFVLTSDSRGSAAMGPFAETFPEQFVEVGIAEQNIVGIASGLAHSGKKPFVTSPACFLSMRSIEQIKVDVAYSNTNVKLVGISGGISYGALGMSHHSVQDFAVTRAIPNLTVLTPCDRFETKKMVEALLHYPQGSYMRIGRNPVEDVHSNDDFSFEIGKAMQLADGDDVTIIACGEMVRIALDTSALLQQSNINCRVINMHTLKPLDIDIIVQAAKETGKVITLEEHSIFGGLGAAVAEVICQQHPIPMKILGIPDEPAIAGTSKEVFQHYGLDAQSIAHTIKKWLSNNAHG